MVQTRMEMNNQILEGNKLISEFMGMIAVDEYKFRCGKEWHETIDRGRLVYHSSWDELMPVIKKCWNSPSPTSEGWRKVDRIEHCVNPNYIFADNITGVYQEVVKFIKWYNSEKLK